ncbi:alanine racemase [Candidatus Aerophobetes bacterium]|nr:alanine racemase [Candidatus Aerophobetes bacterium]
MFNFHSAYLEVNLDAVAANVRVLKKLVGNKTRIMAVVKANAYGHGAVEVSRVVLENGATHLAVATLEEAVELREKAQIKAPILVLGVSIQDDLEAFIHYNLTIAIGDLEIAKQLSHLAKKYEKKAKIHINIDTGMARLGIVAREAKDKIKKIVSLPGIYVEGIFTHFSSACEEDKTPTYLQFKKYREIIDKLEKEGIYIPIHHVADSATLLDLPSMHLDMVRPGIAIYGAYPSESIKNKAELEPVSQLKTRIISLRKIPAGSKVGYGGTYRTKRETTVATIPIGYADGYSRKMSNRGEVIIKGKRAPVIGRICMDHCMIDVTDIPGVKLGDEVVMWGKQGTEYITLSEIAKKAETIVYEIVPLVDKRRVTHIFLQKGKIVKTATTLPSHPVYL